MLRGRAGAAVPRRAAAGRAEQRLRLPHAVARWWRVRADAVRPKQPRAGRAKVDEPVGPLLPRQARARQGTSSRRPYDCGRGAVVFATRPPMVVVVAKWEKADLANISDRDDAPSPNPLGRSTTVDLTADPAATRCIHV